MDGASSSWQPYLMSGTWLCIFWGSTINTLSLPPVSTQKLNTCTKDICTDVGVLHVFRYCFFLLFTSYVAGYLECYFIIHMLRWWIIYCFAFVMFVVLYLLFPLSTTFLKHLLFGTMVFLFALCLFFIFFYMCLFFIFFRYFLFILCFTLHNFPLLINFSFK